jgi:hypothetical protein
VPEAAETLVIEKAECAGISGFRKDWDRPIPLTADGAMLVPEDETTRFGGGGVADWDDPEKPAQTACRSTSALPR